MKPTLSVYEYEKLLQTASKYNESGLDFPTYEELKYCKYAQNYIGPDLVTRRVCVGDDYNTTIDFIQSMYIIGNVLYIRCTLKSKADQQIFKAKMDEIKNSEKNSGEKDFKMKYFDYLHLPENLQRISKPIHELAHAMVETSKDNHELNAGLRKLLEAKDCFVRAGL